MKKLFFFLVALMLSFTAQATIVECNPGTNNLAWYLTQGDTLVGISNRHDVGNIIALL